MEIIIRHNSVYLKSVSLGKGFADVVADLILDNYGRVKVYTGSKLSFYTDLHHLPSEILVAVSERIEKEASNRILAKIEKRIESTLNARTI